MITVDNGSEFYSRRRDAWAYQRGGRLIFSRPGKPMDNPFIESFNGRLRDEHLNVELFFSVADAQRKILEWQRDYKEDRPQSSLVDIPPRDFAAQWQLNQAAGGDILNLQTVRFSGRSPGRRRRYPQPRNGLVSCSRSGRLCCGTGYLNTWCRQLPSAVLLPTGVAIPNRRARQPFRATEPRGNCFGRLAQLLGLKPNGVGRTSRNPDVPQLVRLRHVEISRRSYRG